MEDWGGGRGWGVWGSLNRRGRGGEKSKLLRFYARHPQRMVEINSTLWCLLG